MKGSEESETLQVGKKVTPKILVVDDDPSVVEAVMAALESREYDVIPAESGEEALEKFEEDIDIVITDIRMPNIDGLELLREIKESSPDTKVIMMTAYASVDSAVEAMREGASDYIRKSIEVKDIRTTILGALENIELEKIQKKRSTIKEGRGRGKPYETFFNLVEGGRKGIIISKKESEEFRKLKKSENEPEYIKISEEGNKSAVSPENLEVLEEKTREFIQENENSVILLDSIDMLMESTSAKKVRNLIDRLEDEIINKKSILIISGNPENIDEDYQGELEYLTSDMPAQIISESLSNHIRRKVITYLENNEDGASFTTLSKETNIDDSPKLSFHLKKLESSGLIEKDREKRYRLTEAGKNAAETLKELREIQGEGFGQITWIPS